MNPQPGFPPKEAGVAIDLAKIQKILLPFPYFTALLTGVAILSFAAIITRISEFDISPGATIFNRYWIATIAIILWQTIRARIPKSPEEEVSEKIDYTLYDILLFATEITFSLGAVFLWAISLTQTSVANSNLLHNMTPVFSTLFGFLLFRQQFNIRFLIGIVVAVSASVIIQLGDLSISYDSFLGDSLALLSAVLYSITFLAREKLRYKFSPDSILLWSCAFKSLLMLPIVLIFEDQVFPISQSGWLAVIFLGIFVQVFGHGLLIYSLKTFSSSFSALCLLLDPVITAFAAWIILAEQLSWLNSVTFIGVLVGIYLSATSKNETNESKQ
ncbi:MAG TPA: DMT family transporter [Kamptonema sp.]|nr:DMT family transporter [Kamptonema sp.]